ncbi:MAG: sulfatase-like hydrolase/transferase, partial [Roseimicrobium sp.]
LMTGRNAIRHGTNNERGLDLSEHLMPQTFKAAGYQTFMCGKWHLGGSDKNINHFNVNGSPVRVIKEGLQYAPFNRGWDSHYGQYSGAIDYFTHKSADAGSLDVPDWWLNGVQQDGPSEHTDSRGYGGWSPTLLADKAIAHIQNRNPAQPMLLHLAFNSIHGPVSAPPALITKYANLGVTNTQRRLISAAVDGMDQEMGRVLTAINNAGIANNTVIIWFGDNGGDEPKGSLNDPLRGTKGDSYEGGFREVAGIKWPGVLPAGIISNQHMWVGDVFPTLCAATGVTPQNTKPLDGVNLWPALLAASNSTTVSRGTPLVTVSSTPVAIYQFTDPVNGGVKDFKLIRTRVSNVLAPELYNLTDDPYETTDLIANSAYASIVTTLTNAVTAITVENMKPYVGPPLITNSVPQGGTITLYAPFTSWPGAAPTVQWRKGGSNVAGGVVTQITDDLAVAVRGTYAATLTLTNVSPSDAGSYVVIVSNNVGSTTSDAGTLTVTVGGPTIANVSTGPTAPTYLDATYVLASVTPAAGNTVSQVQLVYDNGQLLRNSVFSETMRTAAASPWTGDGCNNAWLPTPASTTDISQTTNANHGTGNPCGLEFKRGTATMGDRSVTTASAINAAGSAGYVEFWVATSNLSAGLGWAFQTSTDGITWNTRLSEVDGTAHGFTTVYHYDLALAELVSTLKLRFLFAGNGLGGASASKVQIDDLTVVTTAPAPPVTLSMFDDGHHGDGAANDGIWGAQIPAQTGGTTVNFRVVATDNTNASSTSPGSGNYIYTVNNLLTDATFVGAEFLTLPKTDGITLNLVASANQEVFVEYGTQPGKYTLATTPTTFSIDTAKPEFKNPIRIPITGLQPDTEYYYRVRHRNVGAPFYTARGERSFHTARPRGTTFSFTVTADPHIDVNTDMQLFWRAMANVSLDNPDIHMDVG